MGLYELAGFVRGVVAFTLAWPSLALLLAWSRTAPARVLRWLVAAVMVGPAFQLHWAFAWERGGSTLQIGGVLGLALCVATTVRLVVVTDALGERWPVLSSPVARGLGLIAAWGTLPLAMRPAI